MWVVFAFGEFVFDEVAYELRRGSTVLKVDPKVLDLLGYLLRRPGELVTRDELIDNVWEGRALSHSVLSGAIWSLRKVLGTGKGKEGLVSTVYGRGYRLSVEVRVQPPPTQAGAVAPVPALAPDPGTAAQVVDRHGVGRPEVVARLAALIGSAQGGRGALVAIEGEPGIGKTHLAETLANQADTLGLRKAWAHCRASAAQPAFFPVVQWFREFGRQGLSEEPAAAVAELLSLLKFEGAKPTQQKEVGSGASHLVLDQITRGLSAIASEGPVVVFLDDAQWADIATLRLVAYLAPEIVHMPMLVVVTVRTLPRPDPESPLAELLAHRNCEQIRLERLSEWEVAEYTERHFGVARADLAAAVYAKSEGIPFFMVELLRPFSASSPPTAEQLNLSGGALDIVRQRLRGLPEAARALLTAAAVVGRRFDTGLLSEVSHVEPTEILALIEPASSSGLVRHVVLEPGHFEFSHDLTRGALLEDSSRVRQAEIHLRVADALEQRYPVASTVPSADLVFHSLAALPFGDAHKVTRFVLALAGQFTVLCAHADAAALMKQALRALEQVPGHHARLRCDLLLPLARSERLVGDKQFAGRLKEAVGLGIQHGFGDVLAAAGCRMSSAPGFAVHRNARALLVEADRLLGPEEDSQRARALAHLSWTAPDCEDKARVAELLERSVSCAERSGDTIAMGSALSAQLYYSEGPGNGEQATAIRQRLTMLNLNEPRMVRAYWATQIEFSRAVTALQAGDLVAAEDAIGAFGKAVSTVKHQELDWHHRRAKIVMRMNRGQWQGVQEDLDLLKADGRSRGLRFLGGVIATDYGALQREVLGSDEGAEAARALVLRPEDGPGGKAVKLQRICHFGELDRARSLLADQFPVESLEKLPSNRDYLAVLARLASVAAATGSLQHAEALSELLLPHQDYFAADITLHCEGAVPYFLGLLSVALGRVDDAGRQFASAALKAEQAGFANHAVHALAALYKNMPEAKQRAPRGLAILSDVQQRARKMGLMPLLLAL